MQIAYVCISMVSAFFVVTSANRVTAQEGYPPGLPVYPPVGNGTLCATCFSSDGFWDGGAGGIGLCICSEQILALHPPGTTSDGTCWWTSPFYIGEPMPDPECKGGSCVFLVSITVTCSACCEPMLATYGVWNYSLELPPFTNPGESIPSPSGGSTAEIDIDPLPEGEQLCPGSSSTATIGPLTMHVFCSSSSLLYIISPDGGWLAHRVACSPCQDEPTSW